MLYKSIIQIKHIDIACILSENCFMKINRGEIGKVPANFEVLAKTARVNNCVIYYKPTKVWFILYRFQMIKLFKLGRRG